VNHGWYGKVLVRLLPWVSKHVYEWQPELRILVVTHPGASLAAGVPYSWSDSAAGGSQRATLSHIILICNDNMFVCH